MAEALAAMFASSLAVGGARAVYVHVPFCRHRCGYCNFTLIAGRDDLVPSYLRALAAELQSLPSAGAVDTLYFGGGTPTHLPASDFLALAELVLERFPLAAGYEWTVEANPADVDERSARLLGTLGVTRVSLGAQSFSPRKLQLLERDHSAETIQRATQLLREHVAQISLDLIFGVAGESQDEWRGDLEAGMALQPDHISTYGLTIERGTAFWNRRLHGELLAVEDDREAAMYEAAIDELAAAGFEQYEVSNFARAGRRSRHNQVYWTGEPYHGVGAGAASFDGLTRRMNHRSTFTYIRRLLAGRSPLAESETLTPEGRARERLVFGLRRIEGVDRRHFRASTGFDVDFLVGEPLARYVRWGLIQDDGRHLRLTRRGLLVSDSLWPDFLVETPDRSAGKLEI